MEMALNIWNLKCSDCKGPCAGGFKKCARLPCSGVDIYQYTKTSQSVQTGESEDNTFVFHHKRYEDVNRQTVLTELKKYSTKCSTCRCIIKRVRNLLDVLELPDIKDVFAICDHCRRSSGIPCKRCEYIVRKFQCCNSQVEERNRRFTDWISMIKGLLQSILDTSLANRDVVANIDDLQELERLLREIYPQSETRCTPIIEDWCNTSASLSKLYENKEILRKILERMKDESLWMTCPAAGPCMVVDSGRSRLSLGPSERLALPLVPPKNVPTVKTPVKKNVTKRSNVVDKATLGPTKSIPTNKTKDQVPEKIPPQKTQGIFYQLSDKKFIDNGWTRLPILETRRLYRIYKMTPCHDEWISYNKDKGVLYYDSGEILAVFKKNGAVTWYYRNGMVALLYNGPEEASNGRPCMYMLYSFEVDTRKRQSILAKFDYRGNGAVYDSQGNERLKYNQNSGELLDKKLGPPSQWLWHNLNTLPEYGTKFIDTYEKNPDPKLAELIQEHEKTDMKGKQYDQEQEDRMLEIERKNHLKALDKKWTKKFEAYEIRTKSLRINEFFSLKVSHQTQVSLRFNDGVNRFKLELGLVIHHDQVLGKNYVLVTRVITPKLCRPEWSWSMIPEPSVGRARSEAEDILDCFN